MIIYHGFVRSFLRFLLMSENREPQSPLGTRSNAFNHIPTPTWGDSSCTVGEKAEVGDAENFVSHRRVASGKGFPFPEHWTGQCGPTVPRSHHWQSFGIPEATVLDYNTSRTIYRLKLGIETMRITQNCLRPVPTQLRKKNPHGSWIIRQPAQKIHQHMH